MNRYRFLWLFAATVAQTALCDTGSRRFALDPNDLHPVNSDSSQLGVDSGADVAFGTSDQVQIDIPKELDCCCSGCWSAFSSGREYCVKKSVSHCDVFGCGASGDIVQAARTNTIRSVIRGAWCGVGFLAFNSLAGVLYAAEGIVEENAPLLGVGLHGIAIASHGASVVEAGLAGREFFRAGYHGYAVDWKSNKVHPSGDIEGK